MLVYQYELFKMIPKESISSMFTRITIITNSLDALGRTYTSIDIVSKILRSLPKTWEAKVTEIREAKNLTKLSLKKLIGLLMTHEIIMKKQELEEMPKKNLAFKTIHHVDSDDDDEEKEVEGGHCTNHRQFQNFLIKK
ncbi:hypothetical protein NC651_032816 [Populus alba x Populus x berolinensis]|nr:hypothetical protein NC651_032816 [Populus alba x Populus x berolinensis]